MLIKPLIHIGYHKTATTWLQRELFSVDSDVFVPMSPDNNPNVGKYLGRQFIRDRDGYLLSPFELNRETILLELEYILGKIDIGSRVPVLSYERLSGNPHSGGFDAGIIADRIQACFPEARIFCVIRQQKEILLSTYFQYLKIGGTDTLKTYLTRSYDGRRPGFSPAHLNYVDLVSCYYRLFPRENVLVLPYEMFRNQTRLFLDRLGKFVSLDISDRTARAEIRYNKRADDAITPRLPFLNLFLESSSVNAYSPLCTPLAKPLLRFINRLLPFDRGAYVKKLCQQIDTIVGDRYEAGNRRLSAITGIDLSAYGYHD
jgi:Sulfotransferase domain